MKIRACARSLYHSGRNQGKKKKSLSLITVTSCYAREGRRVLNATSARALPPRLDDENDQYRVVGEKEYWM